MPTQKLVSSALCKELGIVLEQTLSRNLGMARMRDVVYDPENQVGLGVWLELLPGTR